MAVTTPVFSGFATFCFLLSLIYTFIKRREFLYGNRFRERGWAYWVICFFLLANEALTILEIARYSTSNESVGLLPVQLVGILLAAIFHHLVLASRRISLFVFYLASMLFLGIQIYFIQNQPNNKSYPNSDQLIDTGCILGIFGALAILEFIQQPLY